MKERFLVAGIHLSSSSVIFAPTKRCPRSILLTTIVLLSCVLTKAPLVLENGKANVALDTQLDARMASR